ncbi:hypothetical protein Rhopal_005594-T1 [Rhodotorula paludigena]|uniref:Small EDRK-rich factor-like N-terminal domain-containing protein n=1 Tax=Rhodotorula paludigena TaxID=86838 RepID=A0AAV5GRJ7_9BASI|nr:hypothetical protein Rhopal_005594-T1 [Rhodotorula paludigena]
MARSADPSGLAQGAISGTRHAREKAQKKAADASKGKRNDDGKSFKQRAESDAEIMRKKQEAAAAKKAAEAAGAKA